MSEIIYLSQQETIDIFKNFILKAKCLYDHLLYYFNKSYSILFLTEISELIQNIHETKLIENINIQSILDLIKIITTTPNYQLLHNLELSNILYSIQDLLSNFTFLADDIVRTFVDINNYLDYYCEDEKEKAIGKEQYRLNNYDKIHELCGIVLKFTNGLNQIINIYNMMPLTLGTSIRYVENMNGEIQTNLSRTITKYNETCKNKLYYIYLTYQQQCINKDLTFIDIIFDVSLCDTSAPLPPIPRRVVD